METFDEQFVNNCNIIILQQNIRSIRKNFDILLAEISIWKRYPDIILLTEIWISEVESHLYQIPNYNLTFKTNEGYRAGGIAVYIHTDINVSECSSENFKTADLLKIKINILQNEFYILAAYRLHLYSIEAFIIEFESYLEHIENLYKPRNMFVMGDININILEQSNATIDNYKIVMANYGFECLINEPTRLVSGSCIDHVYARIASKSAMEIVALVKHACITDCGVCSVWRTPTGRVMFGNILSH
jgi:hypothetical protein